MTPWIVTFRGIASRPGRSLIVAILAVLVTAVAVVIPAYGEAAEQSVLTDTLRGRPLPLGAFSVSVNTTNYTIYQLKKVTSENLALHPTLAAHLGDPDESATVNVGLPQFPGVFSRLLYRPQLCQHVTIVTGRCSTGAGEVMASARAAAGVGIQLGQRLELVREVDRRSLPSTSDVTVVGLYQPIEPDGPYWRGSATFPGVVPRDADTLVIDAILASAESDLHGPGALTITRVTYPLNANLVRHDEQSPLAADALAARQGIGSRDLTVDTPLPTLLETTASREQKAISDGFPLIVVPLIFLGWLVLFAIVAALASERGPEIAVAKLRGLPFRHVGGFGIREPMVLLLCGSIIGAATGVGLAELGAREFLAGGSHAEIHAALFGWLAIALVGAAVAAAVGTTRTVRAGVLDLMRRVPARSGWRIAAFEASVGTLCVAAVVTVMNGQPSTLSYLAPSMLALVAGLICARLIGLVAHLGQRSARTRGSLTGLLSTAQLSRRRSSRYLVLALAMSIALLTFGVTFWQAAAVNRERTARAAVGAPRVYTVAAMEPARLLDAVRRVDPDGAFAMAVLRGTRFSNGEFSIAAVDAGRLGSVASWPGRTPSQTAMIGQSIDPQDVAPIVVRGTSVSVAFDVVQLETDKPMQLALSLVGPDGAPTIITLGVLQLGTRTYSSVINGCADGCRLLGVVLRRAPVDVRPGNVDVTITAISDSTGPVAAKLTDVGAWRAPAEVPAGQSLTVPIDAAGLRIVAASTNSIDVVVDVADSPEATPAVVAGRLPGNDPDAGTFGLAALSKVAEPFRVTQRVPALPRIGARGVLFDLGTAIRQASHHGQVGLDGFLEVWANSNAPPDLAQRLTDAGIPVTGVEALADERDRLMRQAPALALRPYLLSGAVAVLLALGMVVLDTFLGATGRRYDLAALRVAGVSRRTLTRAVRREYLMLVGFPLVFGVIAGLAGAIPLLPSIRLVTTEPDTIPPDLSLHPGPLGVAVAIAVVGLVIVVATATRLVRRAKPELLRAGE